MRRPSVRRITLQDFRSYPSLDLRLDARSVVLSGANGAGKTNLLEALSLFTPGRGLRRADLSAMARDGGSGAWAVSIEVAEGEQPDAGSVQLGTGIDPSDEAGPVGRRYRIDRVAGTARDFADHLRLVWLTPAMDSLFSGPASERRRFLDRIVLTVDAEHGSRVSALDRALRNRNRLLENGAGGLNRAWAEAADREVAAVGVSVAAARLETVERLAALIAASRDEVSPFPWTEVTLAGPVEEDLRHYPAIDAEDRYRALLRANRSRDMAAGRTSIGPHRSDLAVRHGPKAIEAAQASTGEQKALVVGLVLAQARLVTAMSGIAPLMLLDEIGAHFDPARRRALFEVLGQLGGQVFMTGADPAVLGEVADTAHFRVEPGRILRA